METNRTKRSVAVVTPIWRLPLLPEEEISLRHLQHYLSDYERIIVAPQGLALDFPGFKIRRFERDCFVDTDSYSRLMLSSRFYRQFADFDYILVYQLDCLVFSNDLQSWCEKGWDYVGAPWFKGYRDNTAEGFWAVGNGGLSLRRVKAFRRVLASKRLAEPPEVRGQQTRLFKRSPRLRAAACRLKTLLHRFGWRNDLKWFLSRYRRNEDVFWSFEAAKWDPEFRIPSPAEAVGFSFEYAPRYCRERNSGKLPFGCHAWYKIDRSFWDSHLLKK
ncbi:MAG: hypothetical protein HZA88_24810 [Verrucomicrobia bacterium]|nr:hypothetical protein [Verrucomicrobiota bacterium]